MFNCLIVYRAHAHARKTRAHMRTYNNITCCSRSSKHCGKVEKCKKQTQHRKKSKKRSVEKFVEKMLNC